MKIFSSVKFSPAKKVSRACRPNFFFSNWIIQITFSDVDPVNWYKPEYLNQWKCCAFCSRFFVSYYAEGLWFDNCQTQTFYSFVSWCNLRENLCLTDTFGDIVNVPNTAQISVYYGKQDEEGTLEVYFCWRIVVISKGPPNVTFATQCLILC